MLEILIYYPLDFSFSKYLFFGFSSGTFGSLAVLVIFVAIFVKTGAHKNSFLQELIFHIEKYAEP